MNDEVRQIYEETFNRIILGIVLISLVAGLSVLTISGVTSPWFIRAVALLIVAGVAFAIRLFGRLVVASYVLVLELVGLVAEIFLQTGSITNFVSYLFIPIVVVAGFLLDPLATFAVAIFSIIGVLLISAFIGQLTLTNLIVLLPPFSLTLLVAFLVAEGKRYTALLGQRLLEDRTLLKERTLEMMKTSSQVDKLRLEITEIKAQLDRAKSETKQIQWQVSQKHNELYSLVQNSIQELDKSIKQMEQTIEQIGDLPGGDAYTNLVETAWQKIYHLKAMMINLEEVTQVEHGKIKLSYRSVDIGRLINEVVGTTRGLVRGKDVEVRCQVTENLPTLQADPVRLRQALLHVLNNAVKYTDQGIIEVQVEMNDQELMIFISDTGIGMHREETRLVFEKFGRGSGTLAQQRQGAGLGLTISKSLIELHGGRMWVTSVLGVGSTFYMTLPLSPAAERVGLAKTIASLPTIHPTPLPGAASQSIPGSPVARGLETPDDNGTTLVMPGLPAKPPTITPKPVSSSPVAKRADDLDNGGDTLVIPRSPAEQPTMLSATTSQLVPPGTKEADNLDDDGDTLVLPRSPVERPTVLSIAKPQSMLVPSGVPQTNDLDDDDATIVLPGVSPTSSDDDENTIVLPQAPTRQTVSFNQPIRRFGSIYIRRFAIMLISILAIVTLMVVILAIVNGPVQQLSSGTEMFRRLFSTSSAVNVTVSASPTPEEIVAQSPTDTPSPTSQPTATPLPTQPLPTPTDLPTEAPPTSTSISSPTPTPIPTATATPTQEPTFTPSPTTILTKTPIATSETNNTSAIPVAISQSVVSALPRLSVVTGQFGRLAVSRFDDDNSADTSLPIETSDNSRVSQSPTGQFLFAGEQDDNRDIYAANTGDSQPVRLTTAVGDDWQPAWSPDGHKVAFSSNRTGNFDIYVMEADGSNPIQLTSSRGFDEWPVWSPDGSRIAFVSDRDGNVEIYTMDVDGGNQQRVTNNPADDWPAAWSPDGSRLVFASERDGGWNLYITQTEGGSATRLTNAPGAERDPIWSADGQTIAFAYNGAGNWDIYTLLVPGNSITEVPLSQWNQITSTPTDERYPAWLSTP